MSIESSAVSFRYFPHINLLRAFAALSVLLYHVIEHLQWADFPNDYGLVWFRIGWMSVDLFFVISGFVIAWSLLQLHAKHAHQFKPLAKEFAIRRIGRIYPLYLLTIMVYIALHSYLLALDSFPKLIGLHLGFLQVLSFKSFGSINGVNWSVAVEAHFYLFALLTSPWWVRRHPLTVLACGLLASWALRGGVMWMDAIHPKETIDLFRSTVQMPMMLDEFATGAAIAMALTRWPLADFSPATRRKMLALAVLAAGVIGYAVLSVYWQYATYWGYPYMVTFWRSALGIALGCVVLCAILIPPFIRQPLWYKALHYLGDISYGIYLWHVMYIIWLRDLFSDAPLTVLGLSFFLTLLTSMLSWHLLEQPAIRWCKRRSMA